MAKFNMKNNKNKSPRKKRTKGYYERRRVRIISIVLVCLVLCAGVSLNVYSKYYKTGYNKGMATASGFYFDSNFMKEVKTEKMQQIKHIKELAADTELVSQLALYSNEHKWSMADYLFTIEMRNYTNQILYNNKDLNISYTVEFMLLDPAQGATYQVKKEGANEPYQILSEQEDGIATFTGTLNGGQLNWDTYDLQIVLTGEGKDYKKSRVLMLAYPTAPSFLVDTKKISGIITADYNQQEMTITDKYFTVQKLDTYTENKWLETVKAESAYVYLIKTTGNYNASGASGDKQKIELTWNPQYCYLSPTDKNVEELVGYDGSAGTITIETLPYSSLEFVFLKTPDFEVWAKNSPDKEVFEKFVDAKIVK